MAEIKGTFFKDVAAETILDLPAPARTVNGLTIIAAAGAGRTVTVTANTKTAAVLDPDAYEAPDENSVVDVADGLPHTFLYPIGTLINKFKFVPSSAFSFSVATSTERS
jgi:hypothetical protein